MKIPIVTIVGRPNVGKSTFFNKMTGGRFAITHEEAGTTRDRIFHKIHHPEIDFYLVDTGGIEFGKNHETIEDDIREQAQIGIQDADVILFMVSQQGDLTPDDLKVAELLRKSAKKKPIFLTVNKCDQPLEEVQLAEFYRLGLGDPHQISALNKVGIDRMQDQIVKKLKELHFLTKKSDQYKKTMEAEKKLLNIALLGKPNVGKSSIINALLNEKKLIVSEKAGTTRDTTDTLVKFHGKEYNFIDTAGLRRRGSIEKGVEQFSVLRTMMAIERCDIALLVIDSSQNISHQDKQTAQYILDAYKGLVIVANKWDIKVDPEMTEETRQKTYIHYLQQHFSFLPWVPMVFTSAVTKKNLNHIFDIAESIEQERSKRISTRQLNLFLEKLLMKHKPTGTKQFAPKIFYITQVETNPPHFIVFVNKKKYFHFSYFRHLENRLREAFGFTGTPIRIEFREKEARYSKKSS